MNEKLRTIVGGRSQHDPKGDAYPRGIEILLKKAKVDKYFRALLLQNRMAAARSIDLELTISEKNILTNASGPVLRIMIENVSVPKHHIPTFSTRNVAAMIALAIASTVTMSAYAVGAQEGALAEDIDYDWRHIAEERMYEVQQALAQYQQDNGRYPTTEEWITSQNPLDGYVDPKMLYDPWKRKFHYQAVWDEDTVVNYKLQSSGSNVLNPGDAIPCPFNADQHAFSPTAVVSVTGSYPLVLSLTTLEGNENHHFTIVASHSNNDARVEWYFDDNLLGKTQGVHEFYLDPEIVSEGYHILLLADDKGNYVTRLIQITP